MTGDPAAPAALLLAPAWELPLAPPELLEPLAPALGFVAAPALPTAAPLAPAVLALPETPPVPGGLLLPLSDEPQATAKHTTPAPKSDSSSLLMIGSRKNAERVRLQPRSEARPPRSASWKPLPLLKPQRERTVLASHVTRASVNVGATFLT